MRMEQDVDSAGVYFLSVEEFEGRPASDATDISSGAEGQTSVDPSTQKIKSDC